MAVPRLPGAHRMARKPITYGCAYCPFTDHDQTEVALHETDCNSSRLARRTHARSLAKHRDRQLRQYPALADNA